MPIWVTLLVQVALPIVIKLIEKLVPDKVTRHKENHYKRKALDYLKSKQVKED